MSAEFSLRTLFIHSWSAVMSTSPVMLMPMLEIDVSWTVRLSVSRNVGAIVAAWRRSNALSSSTLSTDTLDCSQRMIGANSLIERSRCSMRSRSASSGTRSILFKIIRSAKATCSFDSFSAPSGLTSSRCCSMCLASTSVTIPSSLKYSWMISSTKNVCAMGPGSAIPVLSITTASSFSPAICLVTSPWRVWIRSLRTVQQMQPLSVSMTSSSVCSFIFFLSKASSIPTSPNSFSITAMRHPWRAVKMWLSKVVLPLPRNPVRTVTGTRWSPASRASFSRSKMSGSM
mmetsp:Transcript_31047/g.53427  ORF Transcript_31047/g.53427 Transcript_31047/m.53427 type:complete len:287 (+) Transcript_31047:46-906(+)